MYGGKTGMTIVCAACGEDLGKYDSVVPDDQRTKFGLCDPCSNHFLAQVGMPLMEYIEGLPVPVVVVTKEVVLGTANSKALDLLGRHPDEIRGLPIGEAFECENAASMEKCGNTIHCSGCTIRQTVMDTLVTGVSHDRVEAYLQPHADEENHPVEILISTEKKGEVVFLRIENVDDPSYLKGADRS